MELESRRTHRWDIDYGPGNFTVLVATQGVSVVFAFASMWMATRLLGVAGYGGFVAILAASFCGFQLLLHWTTLSLSRYGCEEFVETGAIAHTFWNRLAILVPNIVIVLGTSPLWLPRLGAWLHLPRQFYPLVLAHLVATALWFHCQHALQAAKLPRYLAALLAVERALTCLILVALVLSSESSLLLVASAYIVAPLGACAAAFWKLRLLILPWTAPDRAGLRKLLYFSLPMLPFMSLAYFSGHYLDAFFITTYLSSVSLGIYAVAFQIAGALQQLPTLAATLLMPLFVTIETEGRQDRLLRFMRDGIPALALLWTSICALTAVAAGYLIPIFFGPEFRESAVLLWPFLTAFAFGGPGLLYCAVSNAKARTYQSTVAAGISAIVNVGCNFLLIPRFGLLGCAWATAGAYSASLLLWIYYGGKLVSGSRSWTLQACLPMLFGAAFAAWGGSPLSALAVVGLSVVVVGAFYRDRIRVGIEPFKNAVVSALRRTSPTDS